MVTAILMGLKTSCFTPNFMDYISLSLLYRSRKEETFLNVTGIEIIAYKDSEPDITIFSKKAKMEFFSSEGYGINSSLCNIRYQAIRPK